ncbi:cytochrome c [Alcanivorax sp. 24]|uniref:c-type cytochrome n=1 Tax=Alcanivorax sp. 24 TaxID=2545266 RepID=UPI0010608103|nr:cytochrome c [Alcanivorax sp. 24]
MACFMILVVLFIFAPITQAADLNAGEQKAAACAGCHGIDGLSNTPTIPNLAGQNTEYLKIQLRKFREGSRSNPIMNGMAKTLSDRDIENLAAYFASLNNK